MLVGVGRPRKNGERYPSGHLKRKKSSLKPEIEPISGAGWQRIRQHGKQLSADPRLATELGRLSLYGELTVAMTAAGFRIAEIYGRYEGLRRLSRSAKSPSYNASYGESGVAEELLGADAIAELEVRIHSATEAYERLVGLAETHRSAAVPGMIPPHLRGPIEQLCVEDRAISPVLYEDVRRLLQQLAVVWNIHGAPSAQGGKGGGGRNSRHGPALHFNKHEDLVQTESSLAPAKKPPSADRIAFVTTIRRLVPKMSEDDAFKAFEFEQALKARELFRRSKARPG